MATRIIFNGKEYSNLNEMPPSVRQGYDSAIAQLADSDKNGVPDILERGPAAGNIIGFQQTSISVNGRTFDNVNDMPAPIRALYEVAMAQLDANRNGIPDFLEGKLMGTGVTTPQTDVPAQTVRSEFVWDSSVMNPAPPRTRLTPSRILLTLALAALVLLYFLTR